MMAKVYVFIADGFEEIEGLTVVDLLRRAGIETTMVSISENVEILGAHGIVVSVDKIFEEVSFDEVDMLVLPGGMPGTKNLAKHEQLMEKVREFHLQDKWIAAICAAPSILGENDLLIGKKATCYPGFEEKLYGAEVLEDSVVKDGNIITSRGLGTAIPFAIEIIKQLLGEEEGEKIRKSIVFRESKESGE